MKSFKLTFLNGMVTGLTISDMIENGKRDSGVLVNREYHARLRSSSNGLCIPCFKKLSGLKSPATTQSAGLDWTSDVSDIVNCERLTLSNKKYCLCAIALRNSICSKT